MMLSIYPVFPLYHRCIHFVIFAVRTDETNVQAPHPKMNHSNQPVLITLYVEYVPVILYVIDAVKVLFDVGQRRPIRGFHDPHPAQEFVVYVGVITSVLADSRRSKK